MDDTLRADGLRAVAHLANAIEQTPALRDWFVFSIARPQCSVVMDVFLGSQSVALINIVPQLVVILATIVGFARVDRLSALCLLPLAAWVAYATGLNAAIWLLNS